MIERMRARGFTVSADGQITGGNPQRGAGAGQVQGRALAQAQAQPQRQADPPANQRRAAAAPQATTIDALFGPLPPTESFGQVWLHQNEKLERVRLRLGISDGQQTELIQVLDNTKLDEGTEVVTSITTPAQRTAAGANAFPGLGGGRGFPGGGFPGGGFPGGGGGNRGGGGGRGGR